MNRADWQKLASERVKDAKALLKTKRWAGAYYLAGYAVECGLKSCIIAYLMKRDEFPERRFSEQFQPRGFVMDKTTLVDEKIEDGKLLLDRLVEAGVVVTAACWTLESNKGRWYLYIATPVVEEQGIRTASDRIFAAVKHMPHPFEGGPFQIKAIGPHEPVAKAILDLPRRHPSRSPFRPDASKLGELSIEGAYLYPPVAATVQTGGQASSVK